MDERNPNVQPGPSAPQPQSGQSGQGGGDRAIPQADPQRPEIREPDPGTPRPPTPTNPSTSSPGIGDEVFPPTRREGEAGPDDPAPDAGPR